MCVCLHSFKTVIGEDLTEKSCCQGDRFVKDVGWRGDCLGEGRDGGGLGENAGIFRSRMHRYATVTVATWCS